MFAVYGVMALAVGALLWRAVTIVRRDPASPSWVREGAAFRIVSGAVVGACLLVAAGLFGWFAIHYPSDAFGNRGALYLTPTLIVTALAWGMLKRYAVKRGVEVDNRARKAV